MNPATKNRRRSGGFTLVEVVVSGIVLAMISTIVAGFVGGVLSGSRRVSRAVESDARLGEIEDLLADDLAFLVVDPDRRPLGIVKSGAGVRMLIFHTAAGAKAAWGEVATPVHEVTYTIGAAADGTQGLFRSEVPPFESMRVHYDGGILVAGGVVSFEVEVFDGEEWYDTWPVGDAEGLPALISLELVLMGDDGIQRTVFVESAPAVEFVLRVDEEPARKKDEKAPAENAREAKPAETKPDAAEAR